MVLVSNISALSVALCAAAVGELVYPPPPRCLVFLVFPVFPVFPVFLVSPGAAAPTATTPTLPGAGAEEATPTPEAGAPAVKPSTTPPLGDPVATTPSKTAATATKSTTTPPGALATTSSSSVAGAGGAAAGGAGGAPTLAVAPADVYTATAGSGEMLEYSSCLVFEEKCLELCEFGLYNMNCNTGGLCLCYRTDPMATTTEETTADESTSAVSAVSSVNAAMKRTWNVAMVAIQAAAVIAVTSAFM
ncbi:hypothetical protein DL89DRAFT_322921 [Linderina pennispora]|uniref:Extracellular membrane protein CFEM domain-containing protein n=1 Tax=Linderina pennispora TaxID=61395 RepID=A0A1Y1W7R1_9FUNG|nr:uncharacterized protein DL89DRAFT_322921 [Linderina pennispora]ORX69571.1 hypothetical protein DL89DRAFT_322921 [Linderina pennispora]